MDKQKGRLIDSKHSSEPCTVGRALAFYESDCFRFMPTTITQIDTDPHNLRKTPRFEEDPKWEDPFMMGLLQSLH